MGERVEYCEAGDCDRPTSEGRRLCWMHYKRRRRNKTMAGPPAAPETMLDPKERFEQALNRWAATPSEPEYDEEQERNLNAVFAAAASMGDRGIALSEAISRGLSQARERGVRIGRPLKLDPKLVRRYVKRVGIRATADLLEVSRNAVRRALRAGKSKSGAWVRNGGKRTQDPDRPLR